jgi:formamidopyrimidine-DNA glycosylase
MPELPEVETIRRQMEKELVGARITGVDVSGAWAGPRPGSGRLNVGARAFANAVAGSRVKAVGRRAKLLLVHLSNGKSLVVHLKMTGRFLLVKGDATPSSAKASDGKPGKHTHLVFHLSGKRVLFFEDVRKFGFVKLFRTDELDKKVFDKENYGPEPLAKDFTFARFRMCATGNGPKRVKPMLMAQSCIAGVGNIYADESCWSAGVLPTRATASLSEKELRGVYDGVRRNLSEAVKVRGSSADDYVDLYGRKGEYVPRLKVYGREGMKCIRCGGTVKKIRFAGRGTHFCPGCQR